MTVQFHRSDEQASRKKRCLRMAMVALIVAVSGGHVLAQSTSSPERPLQEVWVDLASSECKRWRVSEQNEDKLSRRPLGRATGQMCRELSEKWAPDPSKLAENERDRPPSTLLVDICREAAERLAGRRVGVFWCTRWGSAWPEASNEPPDDVYAVLDAVPMEAIFGVPAALRGATVFPSRRDPLLSKVLRRHMAGKPDRAQVAAYLLSIGMDCPRSVTEARPTMECLGGWFNIAGTGSKATRWFVTRMTVTVTFADTGRPVWQQVKVKTKEYHWPGTSK